MVQTRSSLNASLEDRLTICLIQVALPPRLYEDRVKVAMLHPTHPPMARSMQTSCRKGMSNTRVKNALSFRMHHTTWTLNEMATHSPLRGVLVTGL